MENNKPNECTNNPLDINLQSACECEGGERVEIKGIPDEYFYNSCDCLNCDCSEEENYCGCSGIMGDPLGTDHQSCICENLNILD